MTDLSGVHNYAYDSIYQLTQATHPNMPMEQFSYDSVGNRISAEGETVGAPLAKTYSYDSENRLTRLEYSGMVAQYKYDAFGRRIEKNVNGDITRYVYDGENIVTEYDQNGNVKNAYLHNMAIDDPLAVEQGGQVYFYHKDGLGSVMDLTNSSGSVVKSYTYKSFGEIYSETGSLVQPYAFTAREYDPESGLYYYRARYYDPKVGRFITKDPIGFAGGDVNLYRYTWNDPINWVDPYGSFVIVLALPILIPAFESAAAYTAVIITGAVVGQWIWETWFARENKASEGKVCPVPPADPSKPPGEGWEWRGKGPPGSKEGSWYNPGTGESLHPDLTHPPPVGPHWDYKDPSGKKHRIK
jgi:RHS repeat-associated protein